MVKLTKGEDQNIEFKESWRDEYLKWICGFANAHGGKIYIGVDDSGNVCGVKDAKKLLEDIPNKIASTLGIVADVNKHGQGGKYYIEVDVPANNMPISYQGIYHYRSGATKQELKGAALQDFLYKKMGLSWDNVICEGASVKDIDPDAIRFFLRKAIDSQRMNAASINDKPENVLRNLRLMDDEGHLKNAALLLFGKDPAKFFTGSVFKIGRFGASDADLLFQDVIEGNIIQMADRVMDVLKAKYLISPIHYEGLQRIEPLEIPEASLREAIFNSIIHKQYDGVPIQMKVYRDSIWLWNNGNLPEGYTVKTLYGRHSSQPRNKNIAEVFYRAGFIESWGRGIEKIRSGFEEAGLRKPQIKAEFGGVSIIMPRNANEAENIMEDHQITQITTQKTTQIMTTAQRDILNYLKSHPNASRREIAQNIKNITENGIKYNIKVLQQKGLLQRIGPDHGGEWKVMDF